MNHFDGRTTETGVRCQLGFNEASRESYFNAARINPSVCRRLLQKTCVGGHQFIQLQLLYFKIPATRDMK